MTLPSISPFSIRPNWRLSVLLLGLSPRTSNLPLSIRRIRFIFSRPLCHNTITSSSWYFRLRRATTICSGSSTGHMLLPTTRRTIKKRGLLPPVLLVDSRLIALLFGLPENFGNVVNHFEQLVGLSHIVMVFAFARLLCGKPKLFV